MYPIQPSPQYTWRFFSFDWKAPSAGEHTIVSRAMDEEGRVQPETELKPEDRRKWKKTNKPCVSTKPTHPSS